jgi:hypothetical protein
MMEKAERLAKTAYVNFFVYNRKYGIYVYERAEFWNYFITK